MGLLIIFAIVVLAVLGFTLRAPASEPPSVRTIELSAPPDGDFEKIRAQLKPRIVAAATSPLTDVATVGRELGAGVRVVLMLNTTGSAVSKVVEPADAQRWGRSADELLAIAQENVRREPRPEVSAVNALSVLVGGITTASWILDFATLGVVAPHGVLVGLPNLQTLIYHPIVDGTVMQALGELVKATAGLFGKTDQPGPIGAEIYWLKDGQLRLVPAQVVGATLHLHEPPVEFAALLKSLGG
jgi:hypothetical protein